MPKCQGAHRGETLHESRGLTVAGRARNHGFVHVVERNAERTHALAEVGQDLHRSCAGQIHRVAFPDEEAGQVRIETIGVKQREHA